MKRSTTLPLCFYALIAGGCTFFPPNPIQLLRGRQDFTDVKRCDSPMARLTIGIRPPIFSEQEIWVRRTVRIELEILEKPPDLEYPVPLTLAWLHELEYGESERTFGELPTFFKDALGAKFDFDSFRNQLKEFASGVARNQYIPLGHENKNIRGVMAFALILYTELVDSCLYNLHGQGG